MNWSCNFHEIMKSCRLGKYASVISVRHRIFDEAMSLINRFIVMKWWGNGFELESWIHGRMGIVTSDISGQHRLRINRWRKSSMIRSIRSNEMILNWSQEFMVTWENYKIAPIYPEKIDQSMNRCHRWFDRFIVMKLWFSKIIISWSHNFMVS